MLAPEASFLPISRFKQLIQRSLWLVSRANSILHDTIASHAYNQLRLSAGVKLTARPTAFHTKRETWSLWKIHLMNCILIACYTSDCVSHPSIHSNRTAEWNWSRKKKLLFNLLALKCSFACNHDQRQRLVAKIVHVYSSILCLLFGKRCK